MMGSPSEDPHDGRPQATTGDSPECHFRESVRGNAIESFCSPQGRLDGWPRHALDGHVHRHMP